MCVPSQGKYGMKQATDSIPSDPGQLRIVLALNLGKPYYDLARVPTVRFHLVHADPSTNLNDCPGALAELTLG